MVRSLAVWSVRVSKWSRANCERSTKTSLGSTTPNNTVSGYRQEDTNMDGTVLYTGTANDRDPILVNVGSTTPNTVRLQQLP